MESVVIYLIPAFGLVGLIVMGIKSAWVTKQSVGDEKMATLAKHIADGAMAFLKAEWKVLEKCNENQSVVQVDLRTNPEHLIEITRDIL